MILVVASSADSVAGRLVELWSNERTLRLSPEDLALPGWAVFFSDMPRSIIRASGKYIHVSEIHGVVTRLPRVIEADLRHISKEDRAYAAHEATAFLVAWLAALECPVLNKPSPDCLAGPYWPPTRWAQLAIGAGFEVVSRKLGTGIAEAGQHRSYVALSVIGSHCFGNVHPAVMGRAVRLAYIAGVKLLSVWVTDNGENARFLHAEPWPDLSQPPVATAVLSLLTSGRHQSD